MTAASKQPDCTHDFAFLRVKDHGNLGGKHDVFFCRWCLEQREVKQR